MSRLIPLIIHGPYNAAPRRLIHISLMNHDVHALFVAVKPDFPAASPLAPPLPAGRLAGGGDT
jgi:hypothetical protein